MCVCVYTYEYKKAGLITHHITNVFEKVSREEGKERESGMRTPAANEQLGNWSEP